MPLREYDRTCKIGLIRTSLDGTLMPVESNPLHNAALCHAFAGGREVGGYVLDLIRSMALDRQVILTWGFVA